MTGTRGGPTFSRPGKLRELRIGLDARLVSGYSGGVESVVVGLAAALSRLDDGPEHYLFLAYPGETEWLEPHISGAARLIRGPTSMRQAVRRVARKSLKRVAPLLGEWWRHRRAAQGMPIATPSSDGTLERAGAEVIHFLKQSGFRTSLPNIYHPHDLQHLHLPQYFSDRERLAREDRYRTLCAQASLIAVTSSWIKRDVERQYGAPPDKIAVIPWAPIVEKYARPSVAEMEEVRHRFGLPDAYLLYPAQTWPHKNHAGLLRALATLAARSERIPLVFSGHLNSHFGELRKLAVQLGVWEQTRWLGFVTPGELMALYAMARAVIIPTKFEAASGPMWEAFLMGVAVAASNVTSLPDQAGDAALLFDPEDELAIAEAIHRLWHDADLRAVLIDRGRRNVARFTWERTAKHFRAYYRRLAGRPLTEEDSHMLAAPPLL